MINVTSTLQHLDIDTKSVARAVENVRELIGEDTNKASKILKEITGYQVKFDNSTRACKVLQSLVQSIIQCNCQIEDLKLMYSNACTKADNFVNDRNNAWMFAEKESTVPLNKDQVTSTTASGVSGIINVDGKFKKGEKKRIAGELYTKHIVEAATPMTNKEFIAVLMAELGMSKAGANSYFHNLKKGSK